MRKSQEIYDAGGEKNALGGLNTNRGGVALAAAKFGCDLRAYGSSGRFGPLV